MARRRRVPARRPRAADGARAVEGVALGHVRLRRGLDRSDRRVVWRVPLRRRRADRRHRVLRRSRGGLGAQLLAGRPQGSGRRRPAAPREGVCHRAPRAVQAARQDALLRDVPRREAAALQARPDARQVRAPLRPLLSVHRQRRRRRQLLVLLLVPRLRRRRHLAPSRRRAPQSGALRRRVRRAVDESSSRDARCCCCSEE
mmetsp:Transcript_7680/g.31770  ORF Transcript_7680/g.31770 Transcript_7680/m.31770 type:complete len:201 (-) Transcript_7680:768-1370(-)